MFRVGLVSVLYCMVCHLFAVVSQSVDFSSQFLLKMINHIVLFEPWIY